MIVLLKIFGRWSILSSNKLFYHEVLILTGSCPVREGPEISTMVVAIDLTKMMDNKNNNDPWLPLPGDKALPSAQPIAPAPSNPLTEMIDSERYIQSLERKLKQLTKARKVEPSSKDIITSLAMFHDDQMRRYISEADIIEFNLASSSRIDEPVPQASFVQRKLHPERQPMSAEEIAELVKEDVLAKVFEDTVDQVSSVTKLNNLRYDTEYSVTQKSADDQKVVECSERIDQESAGKAASEAVDNWANFDELNKDIQDLDNSNS